MLKKCVHYLDEVDALDDVDADEDVDAELDVDALEKCFLSFNFIVWKLFSGFAQYINTMLCFANVEFFFSNCHKHKSLEIP